MKRLYPARSYGKFVCCDGINHDWFMPVLKTFIHFIKACFFEGELKKDLHEFVVKPQFKDRSEKPLITWLGHSTFLIQIAGKNIITDPIFGSLSFIFRRLVPSVVQVQDLPPLDYILISHNHFDHMDSNTLCDIKNRFPDVRVLTPMGDKDWFDRHLFSHVSEHMWWDEILDQTSKNLKITFLPANHWSQRTLFDKNRSLWGSWMIQANDFSVYFAGDSGWGSHFALIGKIFKKIDVALLPIAPGEPRSWVKSSHINAQEAVKAFIKLKARIFIPMHWGTFHLGFDEFYAPVQLLKQTWQHLKSDLQGKELQILKFGQMITNFQNQVVFMAKRRFKQTTM